MTIMSFCWGSDVLSLIQPSNFKLSTQPSSSHNSTTTLIIPPHLSYYEAFIHGYVLKPTWSQHGHRPNSHTDFPRLLFRVTHRPKAQLNSVEDPWFVGDCAVNTSCSRTLHPGSRDSGVWESCSVRLLCRVRRAPDSSAWICHVWLMTLRKKRPPVCLFLCLVCLFHLLRGRRLKCHCLKRHRSRYLRWGGLQTCGQTRPWRPWPLDRFLLFRRLKASRRYLVDFSQGIRSCYS